MDKLDKAAQIGRELIQLQDQHSKAMALMDLTKVNELQKKIADLKKRQSKILSGPDDL